MIGVLYVIGQATCLVYKVLELLTILIPLLCEINVK